jgi:hypothetical protein
VSKCIKCNKEYNHLENVCPACRGETRNDILDHIDDIEMADPYMLDELEGNNKDYLDYPMGDPRFRKKAQHKSQHHKHLTHGGRS